MLMAEPSLNSSDVLIKQNQDAQNNKPNWIFAPPTPELEERGLTSDVLRGIIEKINDQASKDYNDNSGDNYCGKNSAKKQIRKDLQCLPLK